MVFTWTKLLREHFQGEKIVVGMMVMTTIILPNPFQLFSHSSSSHYASPSIASCLPTDPSPTPAPSPEPSPKLKNPAFM
ncbi:MAG: hypothetical protein SFW36_16655 [Leptolyngbyaceae cyanobacterium bins.59]|nr:hypothetical protein [Leptolyngbyaceae cyanobacterium bins.59]